MIIIAMNTGRNILIIDDDPYIANLLLEILNDEGFNGTVSVLMRERRLKSFWAATYDLIILLDVMMPYIRWIRALPSNTHPLESPYRFSFCKRQLHR